MQQRWHKKRAGICVGINQVGRLGVAENNFGIRRQVAVKVIDSIHDDDQVMWHCRQLVYGLWDYIKNSGDKPSSANWALETVGMIPGKRESRRIVGDYIMTQVDLEGIWHSAPPGEPTFNFGRFANADVDRLLQEAAEAADFSAQKPLFDQIQEIIVALPTAPLVRQQQIMAGKKMVVMTQEEKRNMLDRILRNHYRTAS